jgi:hypothetical protein
VAIDPIRGCDQCCRYIMAVNALRLRRSTSTSIETEAVIIAR